MNNDDLKNKPGEVGKQEQFNLYTEKIVKSPWRKVRKIIKHIARIVGSAVLFGIVAGLVMALVYPAVKRLAGEEETSARPNVSIPTDNQTYEDTQEEPDSGQEPSSSEPETSDAASESENSEGQETTEAVGFNKEEFSAWVNRRLEEAFDAYRPGIEEFNSMYGALRSVISKVNRSVVSVLASDDGEYWDYVSGDRIFGIIVAEDEDYFFILTLKELAEKRYLKTSFNDGTITDAEYLGGDMTTGYAVLAAPKSGFEAVKPELVRTAVLGNSYLVQQGDPLVIMGNIYGQPDMAVYSMAVSTKNTLLDTDSSYRLIYTDIEPSPSDCGVIADTSGSIVGLLLYNKENSPGKITAGYGISELKSLIEGLINGKVTPYVGILPKNISTVLQNVYGMQKGVYVDGIEPDSPAYYSGIQSGDIITAVGETAINNVREFQNVIFAMEPGTNITLHISRPGREEYREIEITLELGAEE